MAMRHAPLRMQLNTFYSGPQAWFFLAEERGYLRDEGLAIEFVEGDTAANTIPKMAAGQLDLGYGDLNALIDHRVRGLPGAPVAVFSSYTASPYTIAVARGGPVRGVADLAGRRLAAHPNDAALRLFPEFCQRTGLDASGVRIEIDAAPHNAMVPQLLAGRWDGLFGFVNTLIAASIDAGMPHPREHLHFIEYADHVPELYGMAIMASPALIASEPHTVSAVLRALNRGLRDTVADPQAAIDALARRNPAMNRESNLRRLQGTLGLEMAGAEGARLGIGDLDDARLGRAIELIRLVGGHAAAVQAGDIFRRDWLPPLQERVRSLARA